MINSSIVNDLKLFFRLHTTENIPLLFTFNPSHELALADNHTNFTPNAMVTMMEKQLFELPFLFARENDFILNPSDNTIFDFYGNPTTIIGKRVLPFPWGWNRSVREKFRKAGVDKEWLPSDDYIQQLRQMASRSFAANYICDFLALADSHFTGFFVGHHMRFHTSLDSLPLCTGPLIFKQPWSTSGRGNFVTETTDNNSRQRLSGYLRTQGGFLADRFYVKTLDFAMEFYVRSDASVDFIGYSLFKASENGKYGGNMVAEQEEIKDEIICALHSRELVDYLQKTHQHLLSSALGGKYTGFVGVDMMAVKMDDNVCCHPCVEINLRMNMGLVAMAAYRRPFFFEDDGEDGAVLRSSAFTPSATSLERGFHTLLKSRFISIRYS